MTFKCFNLSSSILNSDKIKPILVRMDSKSDVLFALKKEIGFAKKCFNDTTDFSNLTIGRYNIQLLSTSLMLQKLSSHFMNSKYFSGFNLSKAFVSISRFVSNESSFIKASGLYLSIFKYSFFNLSVSKRNNGSSFLVFDICLKNPLPKTVDIKVSSSIISSHFFIFPLLSIIKAIDCIASIRPLLKAMLIEDNSLLFSSNSFSGNKLRYVFA